MGRFASKYAPSPLVMAVRASPVEVWVAVTVAPTITNPVLSRTVPEICEVDTACPQTPEAASREINVEMRMALTWTTSRTEIVNLKRQPAARRI